ncbi:MAG: methyltransferase domain-containing protein [Candidatus Aminicenantaceae bacterium]
MDDPYNLHELKSVWEKHARHDPLWAILSYPQQKGRKWQMAHFFRTGEMEIDCLVGQMTKLRKPAERVRALDFGCGVGRLSQPLCRYFREVIGVDISPTMISLANALNQYGEQCRYIQNDRDNLSMLPDDSIDLVYSNIVLQHIPPYTAKEYIREFLRIAKADGIVIFQLPSHRKPVSNATEKPQAMPVEAYQARILALSEPSRRILPGQSATIPLRIINDTPLSWRTNAVSPLRCGNHWLNADNDVSVIFDDGRVDIPDGLEAGQSCIVDLTVTAPEAPGEYICEIDVVHELISWFKVYGSPTLHFPVTVSVTDSVTLGKPAIPYKKKKQPDTTFPEIEQLLPETTEEPPPYSVFGIPKKEVSELIRRQGGHILHIETDGRTGIDWVAYLYFVSPSLSR